MCVCVRVFVCVWIEIRHVDPIYNSSGDKMTDSQTDTIRNNETYLFPSRPLSRYCYHIFHSRFLKDKKQGSETILRFTAGPSSLQQQTLFNPYRTNVENRVSS